MAPRPRGGAAGGVHADLPVPALARPLDGHVFILAMLGLSLHTTAGSRPAPACACLLQAAPGASVDRGAGSATTAPPVAEWTVGVSPQDFEAVIPAGWIRERGAVVIELRTSPLVSTLQLGRTTDPRRFGIFLVSVAFSPAPAGLSGR